MRKAFIILTGILFTLLFATCKQFIADIDDYLSRWSSEAFILSSTIDKKTYNDGSSIPSVASANDVTVTLKVQNHKSFQFIMPSASETRNIVEFAHFAGTKPAVSADYELKQLTADTLQLVYKADFLKNSEWGEKDVSSTITLYADDGRPPFKQTFTVPLKANTPPPLPTFTVAKTTGSPAYYVLCITIPDMDKRVPGGLLHKDLARIEVNGTSYSFSVNEAQKAFTKPESDSFITHSDVEKLDEPDAAAVPADSSWVLYYKTDVEVKDGAAKKDYTIKLIDEKGLASDILNASTKPNKAEAEQVRITKGTVSGSGSGSESDPIIIGTDSSGAELSVSSATANTTVHCTVSEIGGSTPVKYDGNPVTVPLPLNGAGEKRYKLEYYTDGEGFAATPVKTIYYKVVQGHTVIFDANGGAYPDSSTAVSKTALHGTTISPPDPLPKNQGYGVTGWYRAAACLAGQEWNFDMDTVTGDIRLYAKWTAGVVSYKVEHYKEKLDGTYPDTAEDTETKPGTTGQSAVYTPKAYEGFTYQSGLTEINGTLQPSGPIAGDNSTVVKLYYQRKQITVTFKLNGGKIDGNPNNVTKTGKYGAALTKPNDPTQDGYTFSNWQPTPPAPSLSSTFPAENAEYTAEWNLNSYTVIYMVDGAGGKIKADSGSPTTNGTISVEHGGSVTFTAKPDLGWEVDYWTGATENTPNTTATLSGVTTNGIEVKVKFKPMPAITINGSDPDTWVQLKNAVENTTVPEITVSGTIKAPNGSTKIEVKRAVTVKGTNKDTAILDADEKCQIFYVWHNGDLTLKSLTLQKGKNDDFSYPGGAIYCADGKLTTDNVVIKDCKAKHGGGIYAKANFASPLPITLTDTEIKNCTVTDTGGGIYIGSGSEVTLINAVLSGNTASSEGGGVYVKGTFTAKDTKIGGDTDAEGNSAANGGGIFVSGVSTTTMTLTNCTVKNNTAKGKGLNTITEGGGIRIPNTNNTNCSITDGSVQNNKIQGTAGHTAKGAGIYIGENARLILDGCMVNGNTINGLQGTSAQGSGVHISGNRTDTDARLVMKGRAKIDVNNDVYLYNKTKITITETLSENHAARITPSHYGVEQVLDGSAVSTEYTKFKVTPKEYNGITVHWEIDSTGTLKRVSGSANAGDFNQLKNAVQNAPTGIPFTITVTSDINDLQTVEITNEENITITSGSTQTLKCISYSNGYKHFHVKAGGKLTLAGKIKLQGENFGNNGLNHRGQYALYVEEGGTAEIKDNVEITGFGNGSITKATVYTAGTITMSGGKIHGNTAGYGGGVYVDHRGKFYMTGGEISGNKSWNEGKAVYIDGNGQFYWKDGEIKSNLGAGEVIYTLYSSGFHNDTDPPKEPS